MCDYSLTHIVSRPAKVGDRLVTRNFGTGTTGFCSFDDDQIAVCVLPGTEIAFEHAFETRNLVGMFSYNKKHASVAIFRQINKEYPNSHHDALETPHGEIVLLTGLREGQYATVLQLPAAPKTAQEADDQKRLPIAG